MPTVTFTDRTIASLKPRAVRIDYFDRSLPGFGVRVSTSGRKTFILFHRISGRQQRLTLRDTETNVSTYPLLTLARARDLARAALRAGAVGEDIGAAQKLARERTFGKLADLYIEQHAKRKKRSWRDDVRMVRRELKAWRDRPIVSIRRTDVRELLESVVARGAPVLANRVLALVRKMLNFALDREWVEANVAAKMARPAAEQSRSRVLSVREIQVVWTALERPPVAGASAQQAREHLLNQDALKLRLLTAQRGGEVVAMRWSDVDLEAGWWTIPAEHAKNKLPHRVPLGTMAIAILAARLATAEKEAVHVFKGIRGTNHRRGALAGVGLDDVRPHDFRRTAASLMAGAGIPRQSIAKLLNHVDRSVTAVYDRHSYDPEKRAALDWWNDRVAAFTARDGKD